MNSIHLRRYQNWLVVCVWFTCTSLSLTTEYVYPQAAQESPKTDGLADASANAKPASIQLQWSDSDQIDGQLLSWRDGLMQVDSKLFNKPIGVVAGALDFLRFTQRGEANADLGQHRLKLIDGSVLVGKYIATSDDKVRFEDYRFGELSLELTKIAKIESNDKVDYAWDGEIKSWQVQSGQWTLDAQQSLHTAQADSKIWLPLSLADSFVIEFELVSTQSLDLVIATGPDPEKSYRLGKIGDSWTIGTRDDFEIVEALTDRRRQLALKLYRNAAEGKLVLLQGDKTLVEVADKQHASERSGILLHNLGHSFTLKSLRVSRDQSSSSTLQLPTVVGVVAEPAPRSLDRIVFKDGSEVWGRVQEFSDAKLSIRLEQLGVTKSCSINQVVAVIPSKVASSTANTERSSDTQFRVQQGQSKLFGSCQFSFDPPAVQWKSSKLDQPAMLNTDLPFSLHHQGGKVQEIDGSAHLSGVAYLHSGEKIPVRLERADVTHAWLKTPFSDTVVQVDNRALRAIDLRPKLAKPGFTKESREMLLSIPRNLELDHFSHALIGQNGDLLRGNLVTVTGQNIEIDSRQEPLLVERRFVDAVLFLQPTNDKNDPSEDAKTPRDKATLNQAEEMNLQLAGGYLLSGQWIGGDQASILLKSADLGECRVAMKSIQSFHFNSIPALDSDSQARYVWSTKQLAQPRWQVSSPEQATDAASTLIGTASPDLSLPNSNGDTVKLADHLGKVVVLDFWATWCGPCVASLPKYVETVHKFADNEVIFFGINSTETPESVRDFLGSKNWPTFDTLFDYDSSAARAMLVNGIPHTVVIGRDGKIAHVQIGYSPEGADKLYQVIEKLLN